MPAVPAASSISTTTTTTTKTTATYVPPANTRLEEELLQTIAQLRGTVPTFARRVSIVYTQLLTNANSLLHHRHRGPYHS